MDKLLKKLESMDQGERDLLRQVLRERKKEEEDGKMEWMYKQGQPDTEDYLTGRRIDKYVDDAKEKQEAAVKDAPGATFSDAIARRSDLDMQTKMREDPLYAIRKKEEEARRRLLENPIKMKQLQKVLQRKADSKKKKKKKKDKKHKKRQSSDDSDSSSDDDDLVNKYLAILHQKKQTKTTAPKDSRKSRKSESDSDSERRRKPRRRESDSDSSDGEAEQTRGAGSKSLRTSDVDLLEEMKKHIKARIGDEDDETSEAPRHYGLLVKDGQQRLPVDKRKSPSRSKSPKRSKKSRSRSKSPQRSHRRSRSHRSRSRSPRRNRHRSPTRRHSRSPSRSRSPARRSRSPTRKRSPKRSPVRKSQPKKKLSAEEMEKRRKEMMEDAKWRDDQRSSNIERYRKEAASEKEQVNKHMGKEGDFLSPILSKHADQSSVEDRLKRNRYSLQKTSKH